MLLTIPKIDAAATMICILIKYLKANPGKMFNGTPLVLAQKFTEMKGHTELYILVTTSKEQGLEPFQNQT